MKNELIITMMIITIMIIIGLSPIIAFGFHRGVDDDACHIACYNTTLLIEQKQAENVTIVR